MLGCIFISEVGTIYYIILCFKIKHIVDNSFIFYCYKILTFFIGKEKVQNIGEGPHIMLWAWEEIKGKKGAKENNKCMSN